VENALKKDSELLKQRIERQIMELTATGKQLQQEITKRRHLEQRLSQQTDELTVANKQTKETSTKHTHTASHPGKHDFQLKQIEQQLHKEIASRKKAEENLAQLQVTLDNINSIVFKHLWFKGKNQKAIAVIKIVRFIDMVRLSSVRSTVGKWLKFEWLLFEQWIY